MKTNKKHFFYHHNRDAGGAGFFVGIHNDHILSERQKGCPGYRRQHHGPEEYAFIKLHPVSGYHILKAFTKDQMIATGAKFHHERYDGKGYPNGLVGDNTPEHARIIGVADAYDAMASNRSYRRALPQEVIRDELLAGKGTQFDPQIVEIMLKMVDEL